MTTISEWAKISDALRFMAVHSVAYTMVIDSEDAELLIAAAKGIELLAKRADQAETAVATMARQEFLLRKEIRRLTSAAKKDTTR